MAEQMADERLLIPVNREWDKLTKKIIAKLGLTWEDWCWLVDELRPYFHPQLAKADKAQLDTPTWGQLTEIVVGYHEQANLAVAGKVEHYPSIVDTISSLLSLIDPRQVAEEIRRDEAREIGLRLERVMEIKPSEITRIIKELKDESI